MSKAGELIAPYNTDSNINAIIWKIENNDADEEVEGKTGGGGAQADGSGWCKPVM